MAPPPAKKRKTSSVPPVIFTTVRHKPDIRMFVFDQEFHVYSGLLKIHAAFFETMLEPSGGIMPTSTSPLFKSDWHTTLDKDLGWVLSCDPKCEHENLSGFPGIKAQEQRAFQNLLSAIFNREYQISDADELICMTNLADYYRALPILSHSLSTTVYSHPGFIESMTSDPCTLLIAAYKLRHKWLFREAFINVLGPWSSPEYKELEKTHPKLFGQAHGAYKEVDAKISKLHRSLFHIAANDTLPCNSPVGGNELVQEIVSLIKKCVRWNGRILWPKFVRTCQELMEYYDIDDAALEFLSELLENHSVLNDKALVGGEDFEDRFLCFSISDAELPWDTTQTDF